MKAVLVVDIYDEEIPKQPVTAIRFNDGDMIYTDVKLISVKEFVDYVFPVEAIPIEWLLKKMQEDYDKCNLDTIAVVEIGKLIDDWRKENEK